MKEALGEIKFKEMGKVVEGCFLGAARTGETESYTERDSMERLRGSLPVPMHVCIYGQIT